MTRRLFTLAFLNGVAVETAEADGPMNHAIAETPQNVTIAIIHTDSLVDGGAVMNDLRFSDGRVYRLVLDHPFGISDKVQYPKIHFTIWEAPKKDNGASASEPLDHNSAAERRLIQLLASRDASTTDAHEKKNIAALIGFLTDRDQPFRGAHSEKWDLIREPITPFAHPHR
jgi:hypothetical protein